MLVENNGDNMNISNEILSDITVHMKYAKYIPDLKRRETWDELVDRNKNMHLKKYPELTEDIEWAYSFVYDKKVLPSMRSLQFAGKPIEISPNRVYNCAFAPIDDWRAFHEIMFLLLGGTGMGYSVQKHHIEKLPEIRKPSNKRNRRFLVGDSIEGWADSIKVLMKSYFYGGSNIVFDFSDIRPKGARLVTSGGKAPGPQPLKECIIKIRGILDNKEDGDQLEPIEVHDIVCHIADAVLAGGIRRAALISLFSLDDEEMMASKVGNWWELNPQRGRANNSAVLVRSKITQNVFSELWDKVRASGSGEPGIYFTNDKEWGTNPCVEISLRPNQFCNLVEINASNIIGQDDYIERCVAASIIASLQASYTDFHYLRPIWKRNTERDALLGVSMTGLASNKIKDLNIEIGVQAIKNMNIHMADVLGINPAARLTCIKPAGTTSLTLGTSSGIHAWHNDYYIRRVRVGKNESIYNYLAANLPDLVKDEYFRPHDTAVIEVPQKAPDGATLRYESAIELLERVKYYYDRWVKPGHNNGMNTHNISATISVKDDEWEEIKSWMWENRSCYNGLSVLPYDGGSYIQAPFEDCNEDIYNELVLQLKKIDLSHIVELEDYTDLSGEIACPGGKCELI